MKGEMSKRDRLLEKTYNIDTRDKSLIKQNLNELVKRIPMIHIDD